MELTTEDLIQYLDYKFDNFVSEVSYVTDNTDDLSSVQKLKHDKDVKEEKDVKDVKIHFIRKIQNPRLRKMQIDLEEELMMKYNITENDILADDENIINYLNKKASMMLKDENECFKTLCRKIKNKRSAQNSRKRKYESESHNVQIMELLKKKIADQESVIADILLLSRKYIGQSVLYEYFLKEVDNMMKPKKLT